MRIRRLTYGLLVALVWPALALAQTPPAGTIEYYHVDALGSVRAVTDTSGAVVRTHHYHPFGEAVGAASGTDPLRFTGKPRDAETGLDYFGARYYAGRTGRFTSVDPLMGTALALTDPQRWNRYSYVGNRPTRVIDPDGRGWLSAAFKVATAVVRGGSIVAEFGGVVEDARTVLDGEASATERVWAGASLASEVASPLGLADAKAIGSFAVKNAGEIGQFSRSSFRSGLARLTGGVEDGAHAHHVFARAFTARFERAGIAVNDPRFGAWWAAHDHLRNAKGYNARWQLFLDANPNASREQILDFGRALAASYGVKVNF